MFEKKIWFIFAAVVLFSLSAFLHFWKIGEVPPGFYWDEASLGYNAYCLAETGKDEAGNSFPLFCRVFSYYGDPAIIYSAWPVVKIFGLTKVACRSVSAFYLICASVLFVFLSYAHVRNKWISLVAGFVFSILPWVFPTSRTIVIGYAPMLLGIIAGWLFLMKAMGRNNWKYAVIAGISWSMVMYCYGSGRPFSALAMILFVFAFNFLLIKRIKTFVIFVISYFCASIPLIVAVVNNPAVIVSRFSDVSVWGDGASLYEVATRILVRYAEYFSPDFLFVSGDPEFRHNAGNSGELYIFMIPFIIAGFYFAIKKFRKNPYCRFLLYAVLAYPAAAVLTTERMHSARCMNGAPFWCMLAVMGFYFIWTYKRKFRIAAIAILCFSAIEISSYFINYFGKYAIESRGSFYASFTETVEYCFKNLSGNETLYVSDSVFFQPVDKSFKPYWYVYFLFYGKIAPATYQKTGIPEYICPYDGKIRNPGIFIRMNSRISVDRSGNPIAILNNEPVPANSRLIHKIPLSAGSGRFFEIYRVSFPEKQ
jgi:4-amino-4-deoxy-L-arabinose transferase-like glycosyltransferase